MVTTVGRRSDRLPEQHTNTALVLEERVRDILVSAGLQEVVTYALTEPSREAPLGLPAIEYVYAPVPANAIRSPGRTSCESFTSRARTSPDSQCLPTTSISTGPESRGGPATATVYRAP